MDVPSRARSITCKFVVCFLLCIASLFASVAGAADDNVNETARTSDVVLPAPASAAVSVGEQPVTLAVNCTQERAGEFFIEVQSKSDISMLMIPQVTVMTQIVAEGDLRVLPRHPADPAEVECRQEFATKIASVAFYAAGEPNQDLDQQTSRDAFLTSGIPPLGDTVTFLTRCDGQYVGIEGVPASYTQFYAVTVLEFPPTPLFPGQTWTTTRQLPLAYDLNSPPVWCRYIATFTLESIDFEQKLASIGAVTSLQDQPPDASQASVQPAGIKVSGETIGTLIISIETGLPVSITNESHSRLEFGSSANFIAIHQRMTLRQTLADTASAEPVARPSPEPTG